MDEQGTNETKLTVRRAQVIGLSKPAAHQTPLLSSISGSTSIRDYFFIIRRRKWIVLGCVVAIVTLAAISVFREKPVYEATGRIAINKETAEILGYKDINPEGAEWEDYTVALDTQLRVVQSSQLAWDVVKQLQLDKKPEFGGGQTVAKGSEPAASNDGRNAAAIAIFKSKLTASLIPNTRIMQISFRSNDRQLAAEAVNTLAEKFIEQNTRYKYESTLKATDSLSRELADMQAKVEESQQKLVDYQKEHDIVGVDEKQNITTAKLDELNKDLTAAEAERINKESILRNVSTETPESLLFTSQHDTLLGHLLSQQADLNSELAQTRVTYGDQHPKVLEIKNKLKEIDAAIAAQVRSVRVRAENDYKVALERESMLQKALDVQKAEANKLNESAIEYTILKRDVDSNRHLYEDLQEKMKEAALLSPLRSNNIRVIDPAEVPSGPISPNVPRTISTAFIGSLALGLGLVFLLESLDKTMRSSEQVQVATALPTIGLIPLTFPTRSLLGGRDDAALKELVEVVSLVRPKAKVSEAYRALGTSILLSSDGVPPKVIMVTSAVPNEGKTTTSSNTAIVLAQQSSRVLFIDADLRRPSMQRMFNVVSSRGLSSVLNGECSWTDAVSSSNNLPSLHFLPAGPAAENPAEMLGSQRMKDLLDELSEKYDHIVIDTPPVLTITDAVRLSPRADAVLLVMRSGRTTKEALCRARDMLLQVKANVLGVVVNALDTKVDGYYSYTSQYDHRYYDETHEKALKN